MKQYKVSRITGIILRNFIWRPYFKKRPSRVSHFRSDYKKRFYYLTSLETRFTHPKSSEYRSVNLCEQLNLELYLWQNLLSRTNFDRCDLFLRDKLNLVSSGDFKGLLWLCFYITRKIYFALHYLRKNYITYTLLKLTFSNSHLNKI